MAAELELLQEVAVEGCPPVQVWALGVGTELCRRAEALAGQVLAERAPHVAERLAEAERRYAQVAARALRGEAKLHDAILAHHLRLVQHELRVARDIECEEGVVGVPPELNEEILRFLSRAGHDVPRRHPILAEVRAHESEQSSMHWHEDRSAVTLLVYIEAGGGAGGLEIKTNPEAGTTTTIRVQPPEPAARIAVVLPGDVTHRPLNGHGPGRRVACSFMVASEPGAPREPGSP